MRTTWKDALLATVGAAALATCGCHHHHVPQIDAVKSVRVLENPDVRTLDILGEVVANVSTRPATAATPEPTVLDGLRAEALRSYPDATVLFSVHVMPNDATGTYRAYAIAARPRGT